MLATLAATIVAAQCAPALAYDAGPHTELTVDAMSAEGFGKDAVEVSAVNNWFVDLYQQQSEVPFSGHSGLRNLFLAGAFRNENWPASVSAAARRSHFDDTPGFNDTNGIAIEWDRLRRAVWELVQEARDENDPAKLLTVLGMSLHQVQDFYSHTNWIEPQRGMGTDGPGWPERGYGSTPTWFDVPVAAREGVPLYANGTHGHRPHGHWNGDGNTSLATAMAKDWPGRPLYLRSAVTAYFASRQWVQAVRSWVGDERFWAATQRYRADREALDHDLDGMFGMSLYSGHWQGQGEAWGDYRGPGGSVLELRQVTKDYFQPKGSKLLGLAGSFLLRGRTRYRVLFEQLIERMADPTPTGRLGEVPSSQEIQAETQFVVLKIISMRSEGLGDPGPDDADMHARVRIDGQPMASAVIHGHDRFSFPNPFEPFTWIKAVPKTPDEGDPVESVELEVRTCDARWAGTDDNVYLRLGPGSLRFELNKRLYNDFERNDRDTYSLPIDGLVERGMRVDEIQTVQMEKARDGLAGGWKLCGVRLAVNGRVAYERQRIDRWLEDDRRTWTAPDFQPRAPRGQEIPVWIKLREDDLLYGGDDEGDINPMANRRTVSFGYLPAPGQPLQRTTKGGSAFGGRTIAGRLDDGNEASITYRLETMAPQLAGTPTLPLPGPELEGPATLPDLVITSFDFREVIVTNLGDAPAGPFRLRLTNVRNGNTVSFSGLAPGASASKLLGLSCNGVYHAVVDDLDQVSELDESGNEAQSEPAIC